MRKTLAAGALALAALATTANPAGAQRVSAVDTGPAAAPVIAAAPLIAAAPGVAAAPVVAGAPTMTARMASLAASTSPYAVTANGARVRSWPVYGTITRLMYWGQRIHVQCYRVGSDGYRWLYMTSPTRGYMRSDLAVPAPWGGTAPGGGTGGTWRPVPRC